MPGLVSILPQPYFDRITALWGELEAHFGIKGVNITPLPHFSYQVAESYTKQELFPALEELAAHTRPFEVIARGIGVFEGESPVVYIRVLRRPHLLCTHLHVWQRVLPFSSGQNVLYSPPLLRPHITLAYQDLTNAQLPAVLRFLRSKHFDCTMKIDNLAYISELPSGEYQVTQQFTLQG